MDGGVRESMKAKRRAYNVCVDQMMNFEEWIKRKETACLNFFPQPRAPFFKEDFLPSSLFLPPESLKKDGERVGI